MLDIKLDAPSLPTDVNVTMRHESLVVGVASGLAVIALASIPAVSSFLRRRERQPAIYEDGDGTSTIEAMRAYSAKIPKTAIFLLSALGCAASLAIAVLVTLRLGKDGLFLEDWLSSVAWVSLELVNLKFVRG